MSGKSKSGATAVMCACGCGQALRIKVFYLPGHDSRHVSQVAKAIAASGDMRLLDDLPSDALRSRVHNQVASLLSKADGQVPPEVNRRIRATSAGDRRQR